MSASVFSRNSTRKMGNILGESPTSSLPNRPFSSSTSKPTFQKETATIRMPEMVGIEGGSFYQENLKVNGNRKASREVYLDRFLIGKYTITFEEYDTFCEATQREYPTDNTWGRGRFPIRNINWYDAVDYCNWLSVISGYEPVYTKMGFLVETNFEANGFRLPTEAEWEYAARGGQKSQGYKFSGSNDIEDVGWCRGYKRTPKPMEVGQKMPNELGLYDMSGNVLEWCNDWYSETFDFLNGDKCVNPTGPIRVERKVLGGGKWSVLAFSCMVTTRASYKPKLKRREQSFRIVRAKL